MKSNITLILICLLSFVISLKAQNSAVIKINLEVTTIGDRAKVFENQLQNYLQNELLKIPDLKLTADKNDYGLIVYIFQLPCKCDWFDFHYRAHFYSANKIMKSDFNATFPISEGFKSYEDIEELAKEIISNLNVNSLNNLRR